ncbi:M24 family metallopeptidase [Sulfurospirillum arcachonense]|uniref:M24 family metallopeptidase n=1 Tax=Sulfurospirillum arcachonense TaxID=57666 RepID=UPI0004B332A4|nr:aminopeptidase P family protein [Sulfurospirillum arcachonense]
MNFILRDENAVFYECGFSCDNVVFLKLGSEAFFITDSRYDTEAKEYIQNAEVIVGDRRDLFITVREFIKKSNIKELVFNPNEWSLAKYEKFTLDLDEVNFKQVPNFSQEKRIIKSDTELDILRHASSIGADAFDRFAKYLNENSLGASEQRLHYEAENILKKQGEYELSFSPIFALGRNAAKCHALPSNDSLEINDLILFDAGVKYKRYCSDRTRTAQFDKKINFSKIQTFSDAKQQKIYDTVLKAQEAGIKKVQTGIKACEVDFACREVIDKAGFGEFFIHSTGHGVGLDIHELPIISSKSETILEEGMIFTIEPGIYLPDEFGVRIEDTIVVTNGGAEVIGQ